jgi:formylglycine-generating enzyme required for sulfatase activity
MFRRDFITSSVALAASGLLFSESRGQAPAVRKVAFLVGVSRYQKDGFEDLQFADDDARDLAAELKKHGFAVQSVVGPEATLRKITDELSRFFLATKKLSKEDVVMVSLSGHGRQSLKGTEEHPYFCPYDAHYGDTDTLLSLNWVMDRLKEDSASSQNLLLVDACRDNPSRGGKGIDGSTVTGLPNKLSVLFSSSAGKQSYESDQIRHGIFTHFVLDGLQGKAADRDGEVTWLGLSSYVMKHVRKEAPRLVNREQEPNLLGNLVRQPVLAYVNGPVRVPSPVRPPQLLVSPFNESEAKLAQRAWSAYLKTETVLENTLKMKLTLIPPGEFQMGSPADEASRGTDESLHRVKITHPFFLGVYEVTQGEWEGLMGRQPSYFSQGGDGKESVSDLDTTRFPVENVSWEEATEFCRRLSKREGKPYRLPTEAEWEYACRAGTTTEFHFGRSLNGNEANVDGNYPYGTITTGKSLGRTEQVGSYIANAFGLYDMHGNVWEWCSCWYGEYPNIARVDPMGPSDGSLRGDRGGGWYNAAVNCRTALRGKNAPSNRGGDVGFRLALSLV